MRINLYSKKQSNHLLINNYVIIYRNRYLRLEERYYNPVRCRIVETLIESETHLGNYLISFYKHGHDRDLIDSDFIQNLNMSGYNNYMDWISDCININSKRRYPNYGAFYLIEKYRGAVND